jgi:hypothetical protein
VEICRNVYLYSLQASTFREWRAGNALSLRLVRGG